MHDIQDTRAEKSTVKNMILFWRLTGGNSMENVLLLTTKWDLGENILHGAEREKELRRKSKFWKHMVADGAQVMRHNGSRDSAQNIVRHLIRLKPTVIRIQQQ